MTFDTARLKVSTKALVSGVTTVAALLQVPAINAAFTKVVSAHPRVAPLVGCIAMIWTLLHNPEVQQALGIHRTVEVKETTETVQIAEPAEVAK